MILTYFPLASTILFGFSFISLAWLSTHLHDYYGRLWQYIYSGARVYDSRTYFVPCIPFGVVTTRITIKRNARELLILGFYMSMC